MESLAGFTSLKAALVAKLEHTEVVPKLEPNSTVRCSSIASMCPREEVLRVIYDVPKERKIPAGMELALRNGDAVHFMVQNSLLPDVGVIEGKWKCTSCAAMHWKADAPTVAEQAIPRPKACHCGETELLYEEFEVDTFLLGMHTRGHFDGVLRIPGFTGKGILEIKTIAKDVAWKIANMPMYEHIIQANMYMYLSGLRWAIIFYWIKDMMGKDAIVDHTIEYDPTLTMVISETLKTLKTSLQAAYECNEYNGEFSLPERICGSQECPRAKECSTADSCFKVQA